MSGHENILIIGAGIAGLSVAYYLNREGFKVTIVDQDEATDNCSYGNAGLIVPSHFTPLASPGVIGKGLRWMLKPESPFSLKLRFDRELFIWGWKFIEASTQSRAKKAAPVLLNLLLKNRELLIELEQKEKLKFGLERKGLLMLCNTEKGFEEEDKIIQKGNQLGLSAKLLSASEVKEMEPNIQMNIHGAGYYPEDAHFHPGLLMNGFRNLLKERDVTFLNNTRITGVEKKGNCISGVKTEHSKVLKCTDVIFCTGASNSSLKRELGISMPVQPGKGYSITINKPKTVPNASLMLSEAYVAVTPMNGSIRFAGTMELAGQNKSINKNKITALKKAVSKYLPEFSAEYFNGQNIWIGLRPCSPDGLPYVGKLKQYQNAYVSTGHSMLGMSLGLASGDLLAGQILSNGTNSIHNLLNPNRYN